jgi:hypothetical protein
MISSMLSRLLKRWAQGQVLILTFHDILAEADPLQPEAIDLARFDMLLDWVRGHFDVVELSAVARKGQRFSNPSACLTFDDGYRSWVTRVMPRLVQRDLHATFFVSTSCLDTPSHWHDRTIELIRTLPSDAVPPLKGSIPALQTLNVSTPQARQRSAQQLQDHLKTLAPAERDQQLTTLEQHFRIAPATTSLDRTGLRALAAAGFGIGAHTRHHPILSRIPFEAAKREILDSREELLTELRVPIEGFAYPNGKPGLDFNDRHVELVRESGFSYAVTTQSGSVSPTDDRYLLKRFTPWGHSPLACSRQVLSTLIRER